MEASHAELVEAAASGTRRSVDALIRHHLASLAAFVHLRAGPGLLACESTMDLVKSACREVLADLAAHRYRTEAEFKRWLYLAAERKILDRARYWARAKRRAAEPAGLFSVDAEHVLRGCASFYTPSQDAIAHEELARFERAFQALPGHYRDVILFSRILGLPHAEVGRLMGRSESAARVLLHRALARLARSVDTAG